MWGAVARCMGPGYQNASSMNGNEEGNRLGIDIE